MNLGQFQSRLHGFRPGISEIDATALIAGREPREHLGKLHHVFVIEIGARHVDQAGGLPLNRFDHRGVAVSGSDNGNAGIEIEEAVAVNVSNDGSFGVIDDKRIATGVRRRQHRGVAFDNAARARSRHVITGDHGILL